MAIHKAKYINALGLGGAMWWELDADKPEETGQALIRTVREQLGQLEWRENELYYPGSISILGTFPELDESESMLSLNTTTSNPSLFPPTAAGNDSVSHFPRWHIPLNKLVTLQSLLHRSRARLREKLFVSVIVCALVVEQPVLRQRKEEKSRGMVGTLCIGRWEVTAPPLGNGNENAEKIEVKLWEGFARDWGDDKVRRGDVVLLDSSF
ncbi:MAG: hypothetical protein TREMPRED_002055 [Tremellales sp. Tagirdzhanova-0007]|nr:MAG: hypothetical protein TREMPRED_002055 [Tremellales sp. Tagirdzhanova-0007]